MTAPTPFRATSHLGLGPNRRDLAAARSPVDWVRQQLGASVRIENLPSASSQVALFQNFKTARTKAKQAPLLTTERIAELRKLQETYRTRLKEALSEGLDQRFQLGVSTDFPVLERLALFWSNHFSVSREGKPQIQSACVAYENEVIRANLGGTFSDMLVSAIQHPVMLLYLDNSSSIGTGSPVGRRRKRTGINENLAREILELHTLGVGGGYSQSDVMALARIITGWTVGNSPSRRLGLEQGAFAFLEPMHEPGPQQLLGRRYAEGGVDQGVAALRDLAAHPATARFVARKLVTHLVGDAPPARDVEHIATVFRDTGGHLPSVHAAALSLKSVWDDSIRKFKTPYELLLSAMRGLEIEIDPSSGEERAMNILGTMNHEPFTAPSPAGWPDQTEHWNSPIAISQRIGWGVALGERLGNDIDARKAATNMIDPAASRALMASIEQAASPAQALALLLASPDFQWR